MAEQRPTEPIQYRVDDGVATITLNRPEARNSLGPELVDGLGRRLIDAENDGSVRVVVLTNTGNTFCAGADLKAARPGVAGDRAPGTAADSGAEAVNNRLMSFIDVFRAILDGSKPVIGRIDGHATGGGVGLVAACDLSIMRDDALIGFTEVRIGVAPAVISVVCLPKMSRADAAELFLTGARVSPQRAAEAGLINRAVAPDQLDDTVDELVAQLLMGGPRALAATKALMATVPTMERDEAFAWTEVHSRSLFEGDEAAEGIAAFRERRPPAWAPAPEGRSRSGASEDQSKPG